MITSKSGFKESTVLTENQDFTTKQSKSWRTLTFFKNSGLMIRFELQKQAIYFSFIDKTSPNSYQSFNEGFVIKLDLFALNELVYCLSLIEPVSWDTWREKDSTKYQISFTPFKLQTFNLISKKSIEREVFAIKFAVYSNKELIKQFILSPYEFELVFDLLKAFRIRIINQFSEGVPPT